MNQDTLKIISTWAGVLPVIAGLIVFKKAGLTYRLFTLFLLYGFLTDIIIWRLKGNDPELYGRTLFYIYGLVEALFFFWFIYRESKNIAVSETAFILMLMIPFVWAFAYINFNIIEWKVSPASALYTTIYEMIITVLSSWSILQLTQKDGRMRDMPDFWFLTGIFIYCLCTFIVSSFFDKKDISEKIWFVNDLTNIICYFLYVTGFYKIETKKNS